jgi:hypothetical protein
MITITKQPYEVFVVHASFDACMNEGDTIASSVVTSVDVDGEVADIATGLVAEERLVPLIVHDGIEAGSKYKVTCRVVTTNGEQWELDFKVKIKEV